MGLKSLIEGQVQNAMKILGTDEDGLARAQTFVSVTEGEYDATTRRVSAAQVEYPGIPMALVRFKITDMDETVRPTTDRIALIAALDMPVPADENDKIKMHDGTFHNVMRILSDPADALIKLHVRRE